MKDPPPATVLVVDDDEKSRRLLADLLQVNGYHVRQASDGIEVQGSVSQQAPDAILMDVMMPGMDGFAACELLKQSPSTASIPVLMVTALTDREHRIRGIEVGATDFLTKPIDGREVQLRVRNAVETKRLYDETRENYSQLLELEKLRDELVHMVAHDLRTPLMVIELGIDYADMAYGAAGAEEVSAHLGVLKAEVHRMNEMITAMLDVSRYEHRRLELRVCRTDIGTLITNAIARLKALCWDREITTRIGQLPPVPCDENLIERVLENLLCNAIKRTDADGRITFSASTSGQAVRIEIEDNGTEIDADAQSTLFEKFGRAGENRRRGSVRLGLAFCKMAIAAHGGDIGVVSGKGKGSTFWFDLPIQAAGARVPAVQP